MLCASSPGLGSQFHQWIPNIKDKVSKLQEPAKLKDIKEYYKKIYPKAGSSDIEAVSEAFVTEQKKKHYLATKYPNMKIEDIQLLSNLVTDDDINEYERESGN
jgi:ABC-type ATPase with predicted acetyltransferase domain